MTGHAVLVTAGMVGVGVLTLAVVLLALAGTAAALRPGRAARPVPARNPMPPVGATEAVLFARYARGEIDAEQYYDLLDRAAGGRR